MTLANYYKHKNKINNTLTKIQEEIGKEFRLCLQPHYTKPTISIYNADSEYSGDIVESAGVRFSIDEGCEKYMDDVIEKFKNHGLI